MQVNKNVATVLHIDNNNLGPSSIIAFGEHDGGELYVNNVGKVSVRNTWHIFDGNVPHLTGPFKGERYCLIFFNTVGFGSASAERKATLVDAKE